MPTISMFYGIIVKMLYVDNKKHHSPHIHVEYQDSVAVIDINTGEILAGTLPRKQLRMTQAWVEIHQDELIADWKLAVNGQPVYKIEPLK